jgi:acyl dehydratase
VHCWLLLVFVLNLSAPELLKCLLVVLLTLMLELLMLVGNVVGVIYSSDSLGFVKMLRYGSILVVSVSFDALRPCDWPRLRHFVNLVLILLE